MKPTKEQIKAINASINWSQGNFDAIERTIQIWETLRPNQQPCMECNSGRMDEVTEDRVFETPEGSVAVPSVTFLRCDECQSESFSGAASRYIEEEIDKAKKRKA